MMLYENTMIICCAVLCCIILLQFDYVRFLLSLSHCPCCYCVPLYFWLHEYETEEEQNQEQEQGCMCHGKVLGTWFSLNKGDEEIKRNHRGNKMS